MDNLISFLIGLAFPVVTVVISFVMIAGGTESGAPAKAMAFITLIGIAAWIWIFASYGIAAGFIAFGGWIVGIVIALVIMQVVGKVRQKQLRNGNFDI